jgi:hypothetical protein
MSDAPEVWFAIPSANPENCRRVLPAWREMGYRVAVLQNREKAAVPADRVVWVDRYPGWAASINQLCAEVVPQSAAIVVSGGDDMFPEPARSASELASEFMKRFPDGFGVMQPMGDLALGANTFCGSPWLGRGWIRRAYQGCGPMCSSYVHNWADNELYWVARGLGVLWERPDLTQRHEHFSQTGDQPPAYWREGVGAHDEADVRHFIARAWLGFPGHEPSVTVPPSAPAERFDADAFRRDYPRTAERYWFSRYASSWLMEPEARVRSAIARCVAGGARRIALYGAGTHTRLAAGALAVLPAGAVVDCVIDDAVARPRTLWGLVVVDIQQAAARAEARLIDAVVVSSSSLEDALAERARAALPESCRVERCSSVGEDRKNPAESVLRA